MKSRLCAFGCGLVLAVIGKEARAELSPATIGAIERAVESFMATNGVPGLSIAIVHEGHLAWSGGFGLASIENSVPARSTTIYRSASMGKPMTAVAAMQLVDQHALDLEADIRKYCSAFPAKRWTITPHH